MRVGLHLGYQNMHGEPDVETFMRETNFAVEAEAMGFTRVASGPMVRSSYHADLQANPLLGK